MADDQEAKRRWAREWARKHRAWLKHEAPEEVRELARQRKREADALDYERHREQRIAKVKAYAEANKEKVRAKKAKYLAEHRQEQKEYLRSYRAENRDRLNEYDRAYGRRTGWKKHDNSEAKLKRDARRFVRSAAACGILAKPDACEGCGTPTRKNRLHGHHHRGYDHPVDVQWLCSICHGKAHRSDAG